MQRLVLWIWLKIQSKRVWGRTDMSGHGDWRKIGLCEGSDICNLFKVRRKKALEHWKQREKKSSFFSQHSAMATVQKLTASSLSTANSYGACTVGIVVPDKFPVGAASPRCG